jgi:phosphatidylinositol 4-kinase
LPFEIFSPAAIAVGIQTWTWLIGEKPELEFAIMTEIDAAWTTTIKHQRGIFSSTLK